MSNQNFSLRKRLKSFHYAFNGIKILFAEEHNSRIHLIAAFIAIVASIYFKISTLEWIAVLFAITLVFLAEIINSAVESLCDFVSPSKNETIGKVKDLSAAGVLVCATTALAVAAFIFIPKITAL